MTKWKCEGCRHRCSIETNAHTPMLFCGMGLLEWMKVETAEEWLDLEDEPAPKVRKNPDTIQCCDCQDYIPCYEEGKYVEYCLTNNRCFYEPKAKPDTSTTTHFDPMNQKIGLPDTTLEERIEKLEEELPVIDYTFSCLGNHNGRIEKLEDKVRKRDFQEFDANLRERVEELEESIDDLHAGLIELKKKAHEHSYHVGFYPTTCLKRNGE